jgi:hypothetical protein
VSSQRCNRFRSGAFARRRRKSSVARRFVSREETAFSRWQGRVTPLPRGRGSVPVGQHRRSIFASVLGAHPPEDVKEGVGKNLGINGRQDARKACLAQVVVLIVAGDRDDRNRASARPDLIDEPATVPA